VWRQHTVALVMFILKSETIPVVYPHGHLNNIITVFRRRIVSNFNVRCRGVRNYTISIEQKLLQELDSSWAHIHIGLSLQYFIVAIQYNFYMSRIIVSLTHVKISPSWACTCSRAFIHLWRIFLIQNSKLLGHKFIFL
jgi:hypothetical protein